MFLQGKPKLLISYSSGFLATSLKPSSKVSTVVFLDTSKLSKSKLVTIVCLSLDGSLNEPRPMSCGFAIRFLKGNKTRFFLACALF